LGFSLGPGETVLHDSNVTRSSGPPAGTPILSDTSYTTSLLGVFHQIYGREDVWASASIGRVLYEQLTQYDFTQQAIRADVRSNLPYNVDVSVDLARTAQLAHFADINSTLRDVITNNSINALVDFPLSVDWRGVLGGNGTQSKNSEPSFQTQDFNSTEVNGGIRFQPSTGNHVDLLLRTVHGVYPNGSPASYVSPGYDDHGVDLRIDWTFSGASRLLGRAGFVQHRNDMVSYVDPTTLQLTELNRDYSGPTYDLTYIWQITGASKLSIYGLRQTGAAGDNSYLSAVTKTSRLTPAYQASAKLEFDAYAEWTQRNYFTNVYATVSGLPPGTTRLDNSHNAGLNVLWNPRRWIKVTFVLAREHRDSTIAEWIYTDTVVSLGLQGQF